MHHWQAWFGNPGRGNYHNKEWANRMVEIGLIPSHTGKPGGKRTEQSMTHYIYDNGAFQSLAEIFLNDNAIEWGDLYAGSKKAKQRKQKVKYTCSECGSNIWAKPNINVSCRECEVTLVPEV